MEEDLNFKVNGRQPQFTSPSFFWAWHSSAPTCSISIVVVCYSIIPNTEQYYREIMDGEITQKNVLNSSLHIFWGVSIKDS